MVGLDGGILAHVVYVAKVSLEMGSGGAASFPCRRAPSISEASASCKDTGNDGEDEGEGQ